MSDLSHFDEHGRSRMVDVAGKEITFRMCRASGQVTMLPSTISLIRNREIQKGDVLEIARIAGIMATKRTADTIPLCHPVQIQSVVLDFRFVDDCAICIEATVKAIDRTGVEMEALHAVSAAALTIYDMCKSVDRMITISSVRLEEKLGGKSGHFVRGDNEG